MRPRLAAAIAGAFALLTVMALRPWLGQADAQQTAPPGHCFCSIGKIGQKVICVPDPTCVDSETGKSVFHIDPSGYVAYSIPPKFKILDTAYSRLSKLGDEDAGFGLYSYAIVSSASRRAAAFLGEILTSIPPVEDTDTSRQQLNIFYVPFRQDKQDEFIAARRASGGDTKKLGQEYSEKFYDYKMARTILNHVCNAAPKGMSDLCLSDLSEGPYIFTYVGPATKLESFPPPYLFVDFSNIRERAFGVLLSAFKAQVKSDDIADGRQIDTLKLKVLNITLTAADFVQPVEDAVAALAAKVHSATGTDSKK